MRTIHDPRSTIHGPRSTAYLSVLLFLIFLSGCGKEGPVRPTIYDLPAAGTLTTVQEGEDLNIAVSYPLKRASGAALETFKSITLYAVTLPLTKPELPKPPPLATLPGKKNRLLTLTADQCLKKRSAETIPITLPVKTFLDGHPWVVVHLTSVVVDNRGKHSEPAPLLSRILSPPPPPPEAITAQSRPEGLYLSWNRGEACKRVSIIREVKGERKPLGITEKTSFIDRAVESGIPATYILHCAGDLDDIWSKPVEIASTYLDTFPPDPVQKVTLSPLHDSLRIAWSPSPGTDHYRVLKQCSGETWSVLLDGVKEIHAMIPSTTCVIGVVAVDSAGNESPPATPKEASRGD